MKDLETNSIQYSIDDRSCFIKLEGRLLYTNNSGFNSFVKKVTSSSDIREFFIDIRNCTYLDSTNLGILASLSIYCTKNGTTLPTVFIGSKEMEELLLNVGFGKIFSVIYGNPVEKKELSEIEHDAQEIDKKNEIIEAHKLLFNLNENNREKFKDVVKYLENE